MPIARSMSIERIVLGCMSMVRMKSGFVALEPGSAQVFLEKGAIINYSFRKLSTDKPDWDMMDRNVFRGISFPGWLGITVLLLVSGLYQIS